MNNLKGYKKVEMTAPVRSACFGCVDLNPCMEKRKGLQEQELTGRCSRLEAWNAMMYLADPVAYSEVRASTAGQAIELAIEG